jgi:hypothetical protein
MATVAAGLTVATPANASSGHSGAPAAKKVQLPAPSHAVVHLPKAKHGPPLTNSADNPAFKNRGAKRGALGGRLTGATVAAPQMSTLSTQQASVMAGNTENVVKAQDSARSTGTSTVVAGSITPDSEILANPDGTSTLVATTLPTRTQAPDGSWVNLDPTLQPASSATGGQVAPKVTDGAIRFSPGGKDGNLASITQSGTTFGLGWLSSLPTPTLSGDTATYRNVAPNVDLTLTSTNAGFEYSFILNKRPAGPVSYTIPLKLSGLTISHNDDGTFTLTNSAGTVIATSPVPVMYGAALDAHSGLPTKSAPLSVKIAGTAGNQSLLITPDSDFLSDPAVTYPVTVDPTVLLYYGINTYVDSAFPTTNYGSSGELHVGNYGSGTTRSYIGFSDSALNGATVTAATLALWDIHQWNCNSPTGEPINIKNSAAISGSTTWNNQPTIYSLWKTAYLSSGDTCGGQAQQNIDVTNLVQAWAPLGHSTDYMALVSPNESDVNQFMRFSSGTGGHSPKISVTYDSAPNVGTVAFNGANALRPIITTTPTDRTAET